MELTQETREQLLSLSDRFTAAVVDVIDDRMCVVTLQVHARGEDGLYRTIAEDAVHGEDAVADVG